MTKRINTPEPEETITIPKSSFDNIFRCMEDMRQEISNLRELLAKEKKDPVDKLFNIKEAAAYCGVSRWTIGNYIKEGKLIRVRRGGRSGLLKSELDRISIVDHDTH